jgi:hypothetical protein
MRMSCTTISEIKHDVLPFSTLSIVKPHKRDENTYGTWPQLFTGSVIFSHEKCVAAGDSVFPIPANISPLSLVARSIEVLKRKSSQLHSIHEKKL